MVGASSAGLLLAQASPTPVSSPATSSEFTFAAANVAIAAFTSALVAGLFLLGAYAYQRRVEQQRSEVTQWSRFGVPAINAADDLVARIFDVMVRQRPLDPSAISAQNVNVFNPSRELSTVWRLLQYLAAAAQFDSASFEGGRDVRLTQLRLYVSKARIALKGNLFQSPARIQSEAQEAIGAKVLSLGVPDRADPAAFYDFARELPSDPELQECVAHVRRVFELPDDVNIPDATFLTMAYFSVYLIDAIQDLRPTSKWEEFRAFLIAVLSSYNRTTQARSVYLYNGGDVSSENYYDTYAFVSADSRRLVPHLVDAIWAGFRTRNLFSPRRRARRIRHRARLGYDRTLSEVGVSRRTRRGEVLLEHHGTPGDVLQAIRGIFG